MITAMHLDTLVHLHHEMARSGRTAEEAALHEALRALARPQHGYLTTGQAAERLGVSIPTVKRWIGRGTLVGGSTGGRWIVAADSVERLSRLRRALADLDEEGNPTTEDLVELLGRRDNSRASKRERRAAP